MRRLVMVLAGVTAVAVPISLAAVTSAPAAGATVSITCTKLKGTHFDSVTISRCSVPTGDKKVYKNLGTLDERVVLDTGGTLYWDPKPIPLLPPGQPDLPTTIIGTPTISSLPPADCPNKDTAEAEMVTAPVTGGTSTVTHVGDTFKAEVCVTRKNEIKNAIGTVVDL